ncbi:hypothetical protein CORT_0A10330 [Candida orthopsilosis Co 90-125]|uniref:Uncharacterized protein n=1 Tax=Candida orthopsilosis (strain 90-125) TaxID=1136231 RepID=H8WXB3_CANO9|nr:hypothetical protein CORT_0A10330 [Candida orthopsilosis Co 90-125]CCG21418.1 hypothetical protein CORT_0A10330 [Candida orthopsilosis Co 90-125]
MEQVETQTVSGSVTTSQGVPEVASSQNVETEVKSHPDKEDQVDDIDENTRLTISKESPLSEIATSPLPFDLSLPDSDLDLNSAFLGDKNGVSKPTEAASVNGQNSHQQNIIEGDKATSKKSSHEIPTPGSHNDFHLGGIARQRKDSYESSELSDLGDDESEAETDKMDFLDERDGENLTKPTDLQTLSELTELARMEEIDGDSDEEFSKTEDSFKGSKGESEANTKDSHKDSDLINRKRTATTGDDESESRGGKKPKTEAKIELGVDQESTKNIEETENIGNNSNGITKDINQDKIDVDNTVVQAATKISPDDEDNEAEAEDEEDEDEEEGETEDRNNWASNEQLKEKVKQSADPDEESNTQEIVEKGVEEAVAEEHDTDINEQRELAVKGLIAIEKCFAEVRDKLYDDKLVLLEKELQLCLDGSHPELSKIYQKINGFYQDSLNLANANLAYRLKCVDKETMATRTSIHQNYLRNIMDTKNAMITETTSMWYKINKERNQLDQIVPDFNYSAIPSSILAQEEATVSNSANVADVMGTVAPKIKKAIKQNAIIELVQQRNNLNEQLGVLNGLVKFHGFPSAVTSSINQEEVATQELLLRKASEEEINEDLRAMGIRT